MHNFITVGAVLLVFCMAVPLSSPQWFSDVKTCSGPSCSVSSSSSCSGPNCGVSSSASASSWSPNDEAAQRSNPGLQSGGFPGQFLNPENRQSGHLQGSLQNADSRLRSSSGGSETVQHATYSVLASFITLSYLMCRT